MAEEIEKAGARKKASHQNLTANWLVKSMTHDYPAYLLGVMNRLLTIGVCEEKETLTLALERKTGTETHI